MSDELLDSLDEVIDAPKDEQEAPEKEPEQVEEPAKEPEAKKEEPKADPKPEPKQEPRTIPLAAHLEERRKLEAKLEQQEQARRALEERLAKLENPPKAPEPDPDYNEDPKAYVDTKVQRALKALEETTGKKVEEVGKTAEQVAQEARYTRFMQDLTQTEAQFVQATPDYYDALAHLRNLRVQEIKLFKPDITQDELNQAIVREEMAFAQQMFSQGKNPHQFAYAIAQARGYKKAEPKEKLELPKVEGAPKQLPPDQTLGSGADTAGDGEEEKGDEFDEAFADLFGKRKRA